MDITANIYGSNLTFPLPLTAETIAKAAEHRSVEVFANLPVADVTISTPSPLLNLLADVIHNEFAASLRGKDLLTLEKVNYAAMLIQRIEDDYRLSWYAPLAVAAVKDAPTPVDTLQDLTTLCNELLTDKWTPLDLKDPEDLTDRLNAIIQEETIPGDTTFWLTSDKDYPVIAKAATTPSDRDMPLECTLQHILMDAVKDGDEQ